MLAGYLFLTASIIAVTLILIIFKRSMENLKQFPGNRGTMQMYFFLGAALAEIIPIFIILFGLMKIKPSPLSTFIVPGIGILLAIIFAIIHVFSQTKNVNEDIKKDVVSFAFIGITLTLALPVVSLLTLLLFIE
ncbi:MAG TPA: hypothetical protein VKZ77_14065 [Bacillaceae bacterium]|nr:hypothetical protein [Bacillaceae bacterium]